MRLEGVFLESHEITKGNMEARNRRLEDWFNVIKSGNCALPRFQRFEAWAHQQVTSLLHTVLQDLPAGAVLTLDVGDEEPFISRPVIGAPPLSDKVNEYLLDGQQRLTALWRSLNGDYDDRTYFIRVDNDKSYEAVSHSRWLKGDKLFPVWANEPAAQWDRKLIPVDLLCPGSEGEQKYRAWANDASNGDSNQLIDLITIITNLRGLVANFNIPFLSLPRSTSKDTALSVFIQMNTSSSPLTAYDIVVAQVEAGSGQSLHDLIEDIRDTAPNAERYLNPADWALAVSALLQGKAPTRAAYLESTFSEGLIGHWGQIKKGITKACQFLAENNIYDNQRLATDVVLYPLAALWSGVKEGLDAEGEARVILKKYLWRAFFTERYERTSATRALRDYRELSALLLGSGNMTPVIFNENEFPLPTVEELLAAAWPKRRDRLPRALLALSLAHGALDFADGSPVSYDNLTKREYHHLFPDAWLREQGVAKKDIYLALNCALVTWKTNRNMGAKAPSVYIHQRLGGNVDHADIQRRLASHLIEMDTLISDDYQKFLSVRASLMLSEILRICN